MLATKGASPDETLIATENSMGWTDKEVRKPVFIGFWALIVNMVQQHQSLLFVLVWFHKPNVVTAIQMR